MDECVSVQALYGDGGGRRVGLGSEEVGSSKEQSWTDALTASLHRIAHRGMQFSWTGFCDRQQLINTAFDTGPISFQFFF
jgi:hypothetical protein